MSVLLCDLAEGVATVTLNRPERYNALSPELICRMADLFEELRANDDVRVMILTGAGEKSFCSGGDLGRTLPLLTGDREPEDDWDRRLVADREVLFRSSFKGWDFPKPIIAAINGHCLAGGFELMLGTDIRVAADHALFGLPEARHALIPFAGALARLPRQLPQAVAMELLLTGDMVPAERLAALGLVNHVVPGAEVLTRARAIAERIAANGPRALAEIKSVATAIHGRSFEEGFALETQAMDRVMATEDAREGPRAFVERRRARYSGR
ncbi:enoyl-CoA hydratase/isomerase family protein [Maritimibacter sp. DP1N21-5]|uniref:enoyl-CoA hydratase/isomerase family protein n=1 Tax=Maritimibacter sp. DP1N21-5 TaxID=2836867 RepID=UPI001C437C58|nr:enoyl-CoA hydratase-related protein [Maritimibacter sp. DP1N21-5]MBV7410385.1 enoyl-CoA hydratase/isomerase family protein [Maritimibacter sp. DP1N21-5]